MRISDWSADVCSSDLHVADLHRFDRETHPAQQFLAQPRLAGRSLQVANAQLAQIHLAIVDDARRQGRQQIGRASRRKRYGRYVEISVVADAVQKTRSKVNA